MCEQADPRTRYPRGGQASSASRHSAGPVSIAFVNGLWVAGVCADVVDPTVYQGKEALGPSAAEFV